MSLTSLSFPRVALAAAVLLAVAGPAAAKTAAIVDGIEITDEELAVAQEDLGQQLQGADEKQKRDYLIDYLVDLKLVARAAEQQKLGDGPDFARRLAMARDRLLMDRLLTDSGDKAASEEAMKKFYDDTVKTLKPEEEVRARHILVPTEDEAKKALDRVKKGEDFAKVAAEISKDPGSGKEGGDLGYFTRDRMVKEFADAAFALKPGEVSGVVKSQFGYHIIKLEDRRTQPVPPFEQVKEQLKTYLVRKAQQDVVAKLRDGAKIQRFDTDGKPVEDKKP